MYSLVVSDPQYFCHAYFGCLASQSGRRFSISTDRQLLTDMPLDGASGATGEFPSHDQGSWRLIVFGQALNLEKLAVLQQRLSDVLEIACWGVVAHPSDNGEFAASARLANVVQDRLQARLEDEAMALQVELSAVQDTPKLNQPGLLLMDMDSTVIRVECIDEIAKLAGVGEQVSEVTELAMQGKLEFSQSLINRVACLAGADAGILQQVRDALPLMPGVVELIQVLKERNWKIAIASGGFTYFADYLKDRLSLDAAVANTLGIEGAKLSGKVDSSIVDARVKAQTLNRLRDEWGIAPAQTIAIGDGANDLVMMQEAALGVAYHAKPIVRQQAASAIRFGGLELALFLLDQH